MIYLKKKHKIRKMTLLHLSFIVRLMLQLWYCVSGILQCSYGSCRETVLGSVCTCSQSYNVCLVATVQEMISSFFLLCSLNTTITALNHRPANSPKPPILPPLEMSHNGVIRKLFNVVAGVDRDTKCYGDCGGLLSFSERDQTGSPWSSCRLRGFF